MADLTDRYAAEIDAAMDEAESIGQTPAQALIDWAGWQPVERAFYARLREILDEYAAGNRGEGIVEELDRLYDTRYEPVMQELDDVERDRDRYRAAWRSARRRAARRGRRLAEARTQREEAVARLLDDLSRARAHHLRVKADRNWLEDAARRLAAQRDRYRLAWESARRGRRVERGTGKGFAGAAAVLGDALGFAVMAVDAYEGGADPRDVVVAIRDEFAGVIPGQPLAERVPVVDRMAAAILAHQFPVDQWPDGPPGEGEDDDACAMAAAIVIAITGL